MEIFFASAVFYSMIHFHGIVCSVCPRNTDKDTSGFLGNSFLISSIIPEDGIIMAWERECEGPAKIKASESKLRDVKVNYYDKPHAKILHYYNYGISDFTLMLNLSERVHVFYSAIESIFTRSYVIPVVNLGTEYIAVSPPGVGHASEEFEIRIVALRNNTFVSVELHHTKTTISKPSELKLMRLEDFVYRNTGDTSGSRFVASQQIAVFCALVTSRPQLLSHVQQIPVSTAGKTYTIPQYPQHAAIETVIGLRMTSCMAKTEAKLDNGERQYMASRGQTIDLYIDKQANFSTLDSNQPIFVLITVSSSKIVNVFLLPAFEQYLKHYPLVISETLYAKLVPIHLNLVMASENYFKFNITPNIKAQHNIQVIKDMPSPQRTRGILEIIASNLEVILHIQSTYYFGGEYYFLQFFPNVYYMTGLPSSLKLLNEECMIVMQNCENCNISVVEKCPIVSSGSQDEESGDSPLLLGVGISLGSLAAGSAVLIGRRTYLRSRVRKRVNPNPKPEQSK